MNLFKKLLIAIKLNILENKNYIRELAKSNIFVYIVPILLIALSIFYILFWQLLIGTYFENIQLSIQNIFKLSILTLCIISVAQVLLLGIFYKDTPISPLVSNLDNKEKYWFNLISILYIQVIISSILLCPIFFIYHIVFSIPISLIYYIILITAIHSLSILLFTLILKYPIIFKTFTISHKNTPLYNGLLRMPFFGIEIISILFLQIILIIVLKTVSLDWLDSILSQLIIIFPYLIIFFALLIQSIYQSLYPIIISYPKSKQYLLQLHINTLTIIWILFSISTLFNALIYDIPNYTTFIEGLILIILAYSISKFFTLLHSDQIAILIMGMILIILNNYFIQIIPSIWIRLGIAFTICVFSTIVNKNSAYESR
jgi:hypothetical protein